jgi:LPXTG-site transpeptidase (sortase) family protein
VTPPFLCTMNKRTTIILATLFIAAGAFVGYDPFMRYWHNRYPNNAPNFISVVEAKPVPDTTTITKLQGKPVRISIPSLKIDLPVIDGFYNADKQTWTLTNNKAQYATITPEANNQEGNTFIYGHNRRDVFASLHKIKVGDQAIIHTENGHQFTYTFRSSLETNPYDDSLFYYEGAPILTLQTCSGIWQQNRQLFTFDLTGAA